MKMIRLSKRVLLKTGVVVFSAAVIAFTVFVNPFDESGKNRKKYMDKTAEYKKMETVDETEDMNVIVSFGETPEDVFISWSETVGKGKYEKEENFVNVLEKGDEEGNVKTAGGQNSRILDSGYTRYWAEIKGLNPGKTYEYEIGNADESMYTGSFKIPDSSDKIKFLYLGDVQFEDSQNEYRQWGGMIKNIYENNEDIDFAVIGGDMVNSPTDKTQWESFLQNCKIFSKLPLMTVSGNHEGVSSNNTYRKIFAIPGNGPDIFEDDLDGEFYYFDCKECRFVMLDSSFLTEQRAEAVGKQKWGLMEKAVEKWITEVLDVQDDKWLIVIVHHPVYGMHEGDYVSRKIRKLWTPLMEENGVDMVFCGHQHMYMRTKSINGIVYIMGNSGNRKSEYYNGHNAPFYSRAVYGSGPNYQIVTVSEPKIEFVSFNEKGLVIDKTEIKRKSGLHIFEFLRGN